MSVPLMSFTVGTKDFRRALQAVLPHVGRDDDLPLLTRARCYVDVNNVTIVATDRYTAAMGLASVWDIDTTVPVDGAIDLSLNDIGKILAVFKAGKDKDDDDAPAYQLRIELRSGRDDTTLLRVTDCSGLIEGEHLEIPALAVDENFPNLPGLFSSYLSKPPGVLDTFTVSGDLVGRLKTAATVYGSTLVMSTAGLRDTSPIIVRCTESFLALVMPVRADDEVQAKHRGWLDAWRYRLPTPSTTLDLRTATGVIVTDATTTADTDEAGTSDE